MVDIHLARLLIEGVSFQKFLWQRSSGIRNSESCIFELFNTLLPASNSSVSLLAQISARLKTTSKTWSNKGVPV